jgi:hypothetical protein
VQLIDVDIIGLQTLQTLLACLRDPFSYGGFIRFVGIDALRRLYFRRDNPFVSPTAQGFADHAFAVPVAIGFSRIDQIDTQGFAAMNQGDRFIVVRAGPAKRRAIRLGHHAAERHGPKSDF